MEGIYIMSTKESNLRAIMETSLENATKRGPGEVTDSLVISPSPYSRIKVPYGAIFTGF